MKSIQDYMNIKNDKELYESLGKKLVYLHVHSDFSNLRLLDSTNKIHKMLKFIKGKGQSALALTDHETVSGHVKFIKEVKELKDEKFTGILGNEIYLVDKTQLQNDIENKESNFYHFLLLAKDKKGNEQLRWLSSEAWTRGFNYKGMDRAFNYYTDFQNLEKGHLIGSTACLGGYFAKKVLELIRSDNLSDEEVLLIKKEIHGFITWGIDFFGKDDFYIEIQPSDMEEQITFNEMAITLADVYGLKYIVTTDAHYLTKDDREVHKAYLTSADKEGHNREVDAFYSTTYFVSVEEIFDYLDYLDRETIIKAILNTREISKKVENYDLFHEQEIPRIKLPEKIDVNLDEANKLGITKELYPNFYHFLDTNHTREKYFGLKVLKGLIKKIPMCDFVESLKRVEIECREIKNISKIKNKTMSDYFITMQHNIDIIWQEADAIVAPGRGSAGGYIINYLLEITQINPLKQGVYMPYWRFISAERPDYPDIDIDIPSHKKTVVFNKVKDYYRSIGGDMIRVCTFGTETAPSAINTACRGLEVNGDIGKYLTSLIPWERGKAWNVHDCYYGNEEKERKPIGDFVKVLDKLKSEGNDVLKVALGVEGLINKRSSHACGVVIFNSPVYKSNAIMRAPSGELVTQFELSDCEYVGNLKYDFLNTRTASMIQTCLELLVKYKHIDWQGSLRETYNKYLSPEVLNLTDKKLWDMLNNGKLISAFQFDSPVGENAIQAVQPTNLLEAVDSNNIMRLMGEKGAENPLDRYVRYKKNHDEWLEDMSIYGLKKEEQNIMRKHLDKAHGVCSTQEAMMLLTMDEHIGNFNVVESNLVRKGVAKKIGSKFREAQNLFYEKGLANGARKILLDYVWEVQIAMQRGYGFSLIHGVEYTYILMQQLNLAVYYPNVYWNTAVLLVESNSLNENEEKSKSIDYGAIATCISKLMGEGVKILPPQINESEFSFIPDETNNQIIFGLKGISGINNQVARDIVENRPYKSLGDFYKRLILTKREKVLKTGKKQNTSIVPLNSALSLIKGGSFDNIDNKDRIQIMTSFLRYLCPYKKNLNMQNIKKIIEMGIIPSSLDDTMKHYGFKNFLSTKKNFIKTSEKAKSRKWCVIQGKNDFQTEYGNNFFLNYYATDLNEGSDYYYNENGKIVVLVGNGSKYTKIYEEKMKGLREWLLSEDCITRYNEMKWNDVWNKYAKGSISKWEMDSISFYYHEHELAHVDKEKYGIKNFYEMKDTNEYTQEERDELSFSLYKKIKYPKFPLNRICGTILDKNIPKHSVTLLTLDGVVLVKFYGGQFSNYNKEISMKNPGEEKKTTIEKSWFAKGNKLLITGYRRGNQFKPKIYRGDAYQHTVCLINDIRDDGVLELKTERTRVE